MPFLPGLELCRRFHDELVAPILTTRFPRLRYAAGRLDTGSELLGFDTPRSMDHDWGPRLQLFVGAPAGDGRPDLVAVLAEELPPEFLGFPTRFPEGQHRVAVYRLDAWFDATLGFDPSTPPTPFDWLATPTQRLAELTGGAVYRDDAGALTAARARMRWYPDDVWRYVLACQWARIGQDEGLVGRCAEVGDDAGSRILTARIVRELMRLCLLLDRRWPPYAKWLGSAFAAMPDAPEIAPALAAAIWPTREEHLCRAYEAVAARTNASGLGEPVDPTVRRFHDRPFRVLEPSGSPTPCASASPNRGCAGCLRLARSTSTSTVPTSCATRADAVPWREACCCPKAVSHAPSHRPRCEAGSRPLRSTSDRDRSASLRAHGHPRGRPAADPTPRPPRAGADHRRPR